jgi:hypothetical protein
MLSTQAAMPSRHLESPVKVVWCAETEQQAAEQIRPPRVTRHERLAIPEYASHLVAAPDAAVLFQRPPPCNPLFV